MVATHEATTAASPDYFMVPQEPGVHESPDPAYEEARILLWTTVTDVMKRFGKKTNIDKDVIISHTKRTSVSNIDDMVGLIQFFQYTSGETSITSCELYPLSGRSRTVFVFDGDKPKPRDSGARAATLEQLKFYQQLVEDARKKLEKGDGEKS